MPLRSPTPDFVGRASERLDYGFAHGDVGTLGALIQRRAVDRRDRPYVTFLADGDEDERRLTFGELEKRALAVAGELQRRGVSPGDRVLMVLPSGLEFIETFCGIQLAGMVAVPVYPPVRLTRLEHYLRTLASIVETAACRAVVVDERLVPLVRKHVTFKGQQLVTDSELRASRTAGDVYPLEPGSPTFLQFTSGTTSQPRGALLRHGHLMAQLDAYCSALRVGADETVLSWLPLYHDLGLIGKVLTCLYTGGHLVLLSPIDFLKDPMSWLRAITRFGAVHTAAPSFAYELCVRKCPPERLRAEGIDLSSVGNAGMGGEPVSWATVERFRSHFAPFGFRPDVLNPCYGLAENTLVATGHRRSEPLRTCTVSRAGLQRRAVTGPTDETDSLTLVGNGAPFPEVTVRIVGEGGVALGARAIGEIWVQSPFVADGYVGDREATLETFVAREDGRWLRTGDLGFFSGGDLYVCGRQKDLMIVRGRNFYPQDLEQAAEGVDGVRAGSVVAFSTEGGEGRPEAAILVAEKQPGATHGEEDLRSALAEAISSSFQLALEDVVLLPKGSVPKTSSGKIQRGLVKAAYIAGELAALRPAGRVANARLKLRLAASAVSRSFGIPRKARAPVPSETSARVTESLDPRFGEALRGVRDDVGFTLTPALRVDGLGLDSLERVELWLQLERLYGARVPESEWSALQTLGELQVLLEEHEGTASEHPNDGEERTTSSLLVRELLCPPDERAPSFRPTRFSPLVFGALESLSSTFWDLTVVGREHLDLPGGFILAGNHATRLDGAWIRNATTPEVQRRIVAYQYSELPPFTRPFLTHMDTIPIDPLRSFAGAIRAGIQAVRDGKALLIFPEGLRTHSGRIGPFRPGVGLISLLAQKPIVPFRTRGALKIYPRDRAVPRFLRWRSGANDRLEIRFGEAIHPSRHDQENDRTWPQTRELVRRLRESVELL